MDDLKDRKVGGKTAIYAAVRSGDRECVEQLLELDVNVTYEVSASTEDEDLNRQGRGEDEVRIAVK